ncbi:MAG TPA: ABC transporter permease [Thermoanaerobaculia bacterium]|nr:ABC transporter permease [Thermoanaerobaculia bacterium]
MRASRSTTLYLLSELVKRDFRSRFAGSALGLTWAILQPLSLVTLYWFVFTFMIPSGRGLTPDEYPLFLISGLLPWIGFSEGITRSATSLTDNSQMVRKLTFRSEILVIVPNVSAILFQLIGIALFMLFLLVKGRLGAQTLLLPAAVLLQLIIQVGAGWIVAGMNVLLRDVGQVVGFSLSFLFYLSPILYVVSQRWASVFAWNPLTPLLGLFRSALIGAALPPTGSLVFLLVVAATCFFAGLSFFRRLQPVLADLI